MGKKNFAKPLSDAIREAIQASGVSLNQLAKDCDATGGQLSRFVRGERSITLPLAERLLARLGYTVCKS